jgi:thioredoxin-related protein
MIVSVRSIAVAVLAAAASFAASFGAPAAELVMVDYKACSYCARFNREIAQDYAATEAGRIAPLRKVSPVTKWPEDLAGIKRTRFTPVFILVDKGREIGRFAGYDGPTGFWTRLDAVLQKLPRG